MTYTTCTLDEFTAFEGRPVRRVSPVSVVAAVTVAVACSGSLAAWMFYRNADTLADGAPAMAQPPIVASNDYIALLDPNASVGSAPRPFADSLPLDTNFRSAAPPMQVADAQPVLSPPPAPAVHRVLQSVPSPVPMMAVPVAESAPPLVPSTAVPVVAENVPLPVPRPPEFRAAANNAPARTPFRQFTQSNRTVVAAATPEDSRSFFQRLFGPAQSASPPSGPSGPALAYASPADDRSVVGSQRALSGSVSVPMSRPVSGYDRDTAVYDISAHTVYLPDGTRLEAHSGLGNRLDDPSSVAERDRGATPPHVYDLGARTELFHGVPALRLSPIGGGGIYGRTGILAHTYMLGPRGDSNGCVSFKNYNAFLQAYRNGQVKHLAVVARLN